MRELCSVFLNSTVLSIDQLRSHTHSPYEEIQLKVQNVGPYRMFHLIRGGAEYEIWAVRPMTSQEMIALKWLKPSRTDKQLLAGLRHEFNVASAIKHKNVIDVYEFGTTNDGSYVTMELFRSPNLKQRIHEGVQAMHFRLVDLLRQAATGLLHMHEEGWIHRDVKPDNFLVSDDGLVKLIDFNLAFKSPTGLSKLLGSKPKVQGTHSYMAPEQIRGKMIDVRADIYSFGCMVHELLAGKPPFTGTSPNELLTRHLRAKPPSLTMLDKIIDSDFAAFVGSMLAKEANKRPDSLEEFIDWMDHRRIFKATPRAPEPPPEESSDEKPER